MIEFKKNKTVFYPVHDLGNKSNYKTFLRIESDGSVTEKIFLDIKDSKERERLICLHYLKFITKNFLCEDIGVKIINIDAPWDFELELSNSKRFNVEITSVADDAYHFEVNLREERFNQWVREEFILFHELKKLVSFFPSEELNDTISNLEINSFSADDLVANPLFNSPSNVFICNRINPKESLSDLIKSAIQKKQNKKHINKENTVVIIDNRTSFFDVEDYYFAESELSDLIDKTIFPEIWLYTGYYSDNNGNNAEYSFAPLKLSPEQDARMQELIEAHNVETSGRILL